MLITQSDSVRNAANILAQRTNATFAITMGKEGAMLIHQKNKIIVPGIIVKPVDTTGAGDAFAGAVLYQLSGFTLQMIHALDAEKWKKIIYNANKAGARTCEYMGAMEAFKHLSKQMFE